MHASLAVTCHLHFWQNDRALLVFTCYCGNTGVELIYTQIKGQHRKLTMEKKILPPLLPGLEPGTFLSQALPLSHPCSPHLDPLPELFSFSARERSDGILFLQCL